MKRKLIQEWQIFRKDIGFDLLVVGIMTMFGLVFLRVIAILEPESTYLAFGTVMGLMILAVYELFAGSRSLVNDFNRAVGWGKPRRDFLFFRLTENYVFLLLVLLALSLYCSLETRMAAGWFMGGLETDVRAYLTPFFLPVYALVFLGVKVFMAALMMRNMKVTQSIMLVLWCMVIFIPQMVGAAKENENSLFARAGRGILHAAGGVTAEAVVLLLLAAGILMLLAGVLMLRRQQVTA